MSIRFFLIIQACFLLSTPWNGQAMQIQVFDTQVDLSSQKPGPKSCRQVFGSRMYGSRVSSASPHGFRQYDLNFFEDGQIDPRALNAIGTLFAGWRESGHVKDYEALAAMEERAAQVPPIRAKYIMMEDGGVHSGIRITDSSTQILNSGMVWFEDREGATSPIESRYGLKFSERSPNQHSYIWGLGLLISPAHFIKGAEAMFSNVAFLLDSHYNNMDFRVFGDLSFIESLNFQIYANAKPDLLDHYAPFGFKPTYTTPEGDAITFEDGLTLISVSGADFIRKNFWGPSHPATQSGGQAEDSTQPRKALEQLQKINRELRDTRLPEFASWQDWMNVFQSFTSDRMRDYQEAKSPGEKERTYFDLVRSLYLLLHADIVTQYDPNAHAKRIMIKELLVEGHEFGYHILQRWFSGQMSGYEGDHSPSSHRFEW